MSFMCDQCGECCRNLKLSNIYADLDRGDGTCKYLVDNLCSIYSDRPIECRIDECYDLYFCEEMTKEEYYAANYKMCKELKTKGGN